VLFGVNHKFVTDQIQYIIAKGTDSLLWESNRARLPTKSKIT
jgi:hypothetical protein